MGKEVILSKDCLDCNGEFNYEKAVRNFESKELSEAIYAVLHSPDEDGYANYVAVFIMDHLNKANEAAIDAISSSKDEFYRKHFLFDEFKSVAYELYNFLYLYPRIQSKVKRHISMSSVTHGCILSYMQSSRKERDENYKTYLVLNQITKLYKIGKSVRVSERVNELSNSSGVSLKAIYVCDHDIEEMLHKKYAKFRKVGEWFALPKSAVEEVVEVMKTHGQVAV